MRALAVLYELGVGMAGTMCLEGVKEDDAQCWHGGWRAVIDAMASGHKSIQQTVEDMNVLINLGHALIYTARAKEGKRRDKA